MDKQPLRKGFVDLIGKRFGRLLVLEKGELENGKLLRWVCQCDCGTIKSIRGVHLKKGLTTSCGCYCRDIHYKGYGNLSGEYWSAIQRGAKSRSLEITITIKEAWELFEKQGRKCAITGRDITMIRNYTQNKGLQTASLDRTDSSKGYTIDNIRWTHKDVNIFKGSMHTDDFIKLCHEVSNYQRSKKEA